MVVENKQWSRLELVDTVHRLVVVDAAGGKRELLHPQEQVGGYVEYLRSFNRYLGEHPGSLAGCAFLHNATSGNIAGLAAVIVQRPDIALQTHALRGAGHARTAS